MFLFAIMGHYTVHVLICLCACSIWPRVPRTTSATDDTQHTGRYGFADSDYEVVVPRRVDTSGETIPGSVAAHNYRSSAPQHTLHYRVPIAGKEHHLELRPNRALLAPGAIVETHRSDGVHMRRLRDARCHYVGHVRGHPKSNVAVSTCYGLAGYIQSQHGHFMIEPSNTGSALTDPEHPHLIYRRHAEPTCKHKGKTKTLLPRQAIHMHHEKGKNMSNVYSLEVKEDLFLELLLVVDKAFLNYHRELDVETYVMTTMNMAHKVFLQESLQQPIFLIVTRLIRLEDEDNEINLALTKNPSKTLESFQVWQNKINPGNDSHPSHHDLAIMVTHVDIFASDSNSNLLGLARQSSVCDPHNQAAICQDTGLVLGFVVSHEIGHTLGMIHDTEGESGCCGVLPNGLKTVMAPKPSINTLEWSECSSKYLQLFLEAGFGHCLRDTPTDHPFQYMEMLPGAVYDAEWQCQSQFGAASTLCSTAIRCDRLECTVPGEGCIDSHEPPADGTPCGEEKWCFHGECIKLGERPEVRDGGWGPWSPWSICSRTCGTGVAYSERRCDTPEPGNGGEACKGPQRRHMICATEPCNSNSPRFRDAQCEEFNDWAFPEDGKTHEWKAHIKPHDDPCALFCINEGSVVAALAARVVDGTSCQRGIRNICISGKCERIPCDLNMESDAVEDVCGICNGDGTTCTLKSGQEFFQAPSIYHNSSTEIIKLIDVPENTQNVHVEVEECSRSKIQVRSSDGTSVLVDGNEFGMYELPGTLAWLGMVRPGQESLEIPGPTTEPVSIWILVIENVTVEFSLAVRTEKRQGSYSWDFIQWSTCSAVCGPGTMYSQPSCLERVSGHVEDRYCTAPKPAELIKECEVAPCQPRWLIGDWQNCKCSKFTPSTKQRVVKCMKPIGDETGDLVLLPDRECPIPKPKEEEFCSKREGRACRRNRKIFHKQNRLKKKMYRTVIPPKMNMEIEEPPVRMRRMESNAFNSKKFKAQSNKQDAMNKFSMQRGKIIIDRLDCTDFKLTISADANSDEAVVNRSVIALEGGSAIREMEKIERNKPKNIKI